MQKLMRFVLIAGALLLGVLLVAQGLRSIYGMDFHENPLLSIAYCALPFLALPTLLFALRRRLLAVVPALLAAIYLAVYSALNWRTCAADGYCGSVASTVLMTLRTPSVLVYLAVAILSIAGASLGRKPPVDPRGGK